MNPIQIINLLNVPRIGPHRVKKILAHLNQDQNPFEASIKDLRAIKGIDARAAEQIRSYRDLDFGTRELAQAQNQSISVVTYWDDAFPLLLKKIYDAPVLLYIKGQPLKEKEDCVAIVGTRRFTPYGKSAAQTIAKDLTSRNISVVSGLARGIDTIAHKTAVQTGGRTLAVLGSGLDVIYPGENRRLAEDICQKGTLISEFPLGTQPDRGNFPRRNRIISGLSHATVVAEAGNRSGAILTALNAVDQNRDVFAVPGRINDLQSVGANRLIRNGATPVSSGAEIIRDINPRLFHPLQPVKKSIFIELTDQEQLILEVLGQDPVHIDALAHSVDMDITSLLEILLKLELKNAVQQIGGKQFVRA